MLSITYKVAVLKLDHRATNHGLRTWQEEAFSVQGDDENVCRHRFNLIRKGMESADNVAYVLLIGEVLREGKTLQEERHDAADDAWTSYYFTEDLQVKDTDGWQTSPTGCTLWRYWYEENGDKDSIKHRFVVEFKEGSAEVERINTVSL